MTDEPAARHRRRARREQGPPAPVPPSPPEPVPSSNSGATQTGGQTGAAEKPRKKRPPRDNPDRAMRDLVGAGPSQLGVSGALRARDVNRPTSADLEEAERTVRIVRRNWQPDGRR